MAWKVPTLASVTNGWSMNTETMGVYGNYYLKRAMVAQLGLGANLPEDAIYPLNLTDDAGKPLEGSSAYVLHFDAGATPPVNAFWSITLYDDDGFQVANTLNRFAISSWMPMKYNADGSLDLYFQNVSPGSEKEANWLPAPKGTFNLTMRLYAPKSEALTGKMEPAGSGAPPRLAARERSVAGLSQHREARVITLTVPIRVPARIRNIVSGTPPVGLFAICPQPRQGRAPMNDQARLISLDLQPVDGRELNRIVQTRFESFLFIGGRSVDPADRIVAAHLAAEVIRAIQGANYVILHGSPLPASSRECEPRRIPPAHHFSDWPEGHIEARSARAVSGPPRWRRPAHALSRRHDALRRDEADEVREGPGVAAGGLPLRLVPSFLCYGPDPDWVLSSWRSRGDQLDRLFCSSVSRRPFSAPQILGKPSDVRSAAESRMA